MSNQLQQKTNCKKIFEILSQHHHPWSEFEIFENLNIRVRIRMDFLEKVFFNRLPITPYGIESHFYHWITDYNFFF
jgi:hypothetical protein